MKHLTNYITEAIKITADTKPYKQVYTEHPETKDELRRIIKERLAKDPNADLNDIDVSAITEMKTLFGTLDPHNIKIDQWDVYNVKSMWLMFTGCDNFTGDIFKWDVRNVEDMGGMFYKCKNFNCDLSYWDTDNVKKLSQMFFDCKKFDQDLSSWQLPNVTEHYRYSDVFKNTPMENKLEKQPQPINLK